MSASASRPRPEVSLEPLDQLEADLSVDGGPDDDEATRPVDALPPTQPSRASHRTALLPAWSRDRASLSSAATWAVGTVVHVVAFHTIRLPLYWVRLVGRSPIGLGRLLAAWWRWALDQHGRRVHQAVTASLVGPQNTAAGTAPRQDAETLMRLAMHHRATVRTRLLRSAAAMAVAALTYAAMATSTAVHGMAGPSSSPCWGWPAARATGRSPRARRPRWPSPG